jgi:hypothetical protein
VNAHPDTDRRTVDRALTGFYAVVALVALAGQVEAAAGWLHWPLAAALAAVASVELGGIVLSGYADHRRRLGERATFARLLSATVAAGAVLVNWLGHPQHLQGGFFAGMSALGYLVWLLHSGARRRDQLRAVGKLPPVPPAYGVWVWLRHPALTARARALADPSLSLYASLAAARTAAQTERRQAAIAQLLRRKMTQGADRLAGQIAVTVYDLDTIAARLAAAADYDGLTALLAADLTPDRLTTTSAPAGDASTGTPAPDPATAATPTGTGTTGAVGTGTGTPTRSHTAARRAGRTGTRTAKTARTRTDTDLLTALAHVPRDADGTVPVRRAATHLGCGVDRARRLLAMQGLLRTPATPATRGPAGAARVLPAAA